MENNIAITCERMTFSSLLMRRHIKTCINEVLDAENVTVPVEINVLITDNKGIRAINKAYRNVDKETDVLSFPMFELKPGELPENWDSFKDPDTDLVPLGDMAISLPRARKQAKQYDHSVKREVGYLTIHSVLHLLGYDHMDEGPMKKQMRAREEVVLARLSLTRG